jgi:hypothetical protein
VGEIADRAVKALSRGTGHRLLTVRTGPGRLAVVDVDAPDSLPLEIDEAYLADLDRTQTSAGCWRRRLVPQTQEVKSFGRFEEFVTAPLPEGLGADLRTLKNLCRDDPEALDLIDRETQSPPHVHRGGDVDNVNVRPMGNSRDAALRRLGKDRPDLHKRVLAQELSAHAAMVEAGFRKAPTPLDLLKRPWDRASKKEQSQFKA